jgi:hypothetical protein
MGTKKETKKPKISIRNVLIVILITFLSITALYFGYLYYSKDYTELKETNDESLKEDNEQTTCDFNWIMEEVSKDSSFRVHFAYEQILDPNGNTSSPYAACKDELKSKLKNILKESDYFDTDSINMLNARIDYGTIGYLIDDYFIVASLTELWKIDIVENSVDLLWESKNPSFLGIQELYVIAENNTSRAFFLTGTSGLGGTSEDQEVLDNIVKDMCDSGELGTWVYDTSTGTIQKLYEGETCLLEKFQ